MDHRIMLVMESAGEARAIGHELADRGLTNAAHFASGQLALGWLATRSCSLAVVRARVGGMSGLELLVAIHQRRPDLPVILLADGRDEAVAVAAFRAGAADFIPKSSNQARELASRAEALLAATPASAAIPVIAPPIAPDLPSAALLPTYQNRLRVIGRQFDRFGYQGVTLVEVAGGFLARALQPGSRVPEALEFPDRDFPQLVASAVTVRGKGEQPGRASTLLPTGYEDFLRALGHRLDEAMAQAVTITELDDLVAVGAVARAEHYAQTTIEPLRLLLRSDEIKAMLDQAYRQRGPSRSGGRAGVMERLASLAR